jgi:hypothetical protein
VRGFLDGLRSKSDAASPEDGAIEFSLGGLFKIMCCTYPKVIDEKQQLMRIADSLEALNHRMNSIERSEKNKTFAEKKPITRIFGCGTGLTDCRILGFFHWILIMRQYNIPLTLFEKINSFWNIFVFSFSKMIAKSSTGSL